MAETRTMDVAVDQVRTEGNTLKGHAAVFNVLSEDLGGYREQLAPGCFRSVLQDGDVRLLVNHKPDHVLARTKSGTLRLAEDDTGLAVEADLPNTGYARDLKESLRRGDLDGMSFRFEVGEEEWSDIGEIRTVKQVAALHDVCLATYPAYPSTSVELRSKEQENHVSTTSTSTGTATTSSTATGTVGGLKAQSRNASVEPNIEQRVSQALRSVRKGEARALSNTSAAAISPAELSTFLFEKLRASSVALSTGLRTISTTKESIVWPKLSADVSPSWVAEAATIPTGDPSFTTLTASPKKLAHRVVMSNEVIDDSDPSVVDVLNTHLVRMLSLKLDLAIFESDGTNNSITGFKSTANTQSVSLGTNGASLTSLDPVADAIGLLEAANVPGPYVAVMPPRTWAAIRKFKDTTNAPLLTQFPSTDATRAVFGVPVYVTSQLSVSETQGTATNASSIYVYAPQEVVFVRRLDAVVEVDRSRLFDSDQSEMRAKLRADLIAPNPEAIVRVLGVKP
jgi:HK97 family phage major capsid protein/HK97 family phage prohead protease